MLQKLQSNTFVVYLKTFDHGISFDKPLNQIIVVKSSGEAFSLGVRVKDILFAINEEYIPPSVSCGDINKYIELAERPLTLQFWRPNTPQGYSEFWVWFKAWEVSSVEITCEKNKLMKIKSVSGIAASRGIVDDDIIAFINFISVSSMKRTEVSDVLFGESQISRPRIVILYRKNESKNILSRRSKRKTNEYSNIKTILYDCHIAFLKILNQGIIMNTFFSKSPNDPFFCYFKIINSPRLSVRFDLIPSNWISSFFSNGIMPYVDCSNSSIFLIETPTIISCGSGEKTSGENKSFAFIEQEVERKFFIECQDNNIFNLEMICIPNEMDGNFFFSTIHSDETIYLAQNLTVQIIEFINSVMTNDLSKPTHLQSSLNQVDTNMNTNSKIEATTNPSNDAENFQSSVPDKILTNEIFMTSNPVLNDSKIDHHSDHENDILHEFRMLEKYHSGNHEQLCGENKNDAENFNLFQSSLANSITKPEVDEKHFSNVEPHDAIGKSNVDINLNDNKLNTPIECDELINDHISNIAEGDMHDPFINSDLDDSSFTFERNPASNEGIIPFVEDDESANKYSNILIERMQEYTRQFQMKAQCSKKEETRLEPEKRKRKIAHLINSRSDSSLLCTETNSNGPVQDLLTPNKVTPNDFSNNTLPTSGDSTSSDFSTHSVDSFTIDTSVNNCTANNIFEKEVNYRMQIKEDLTKPPQSINHLSNTPLKIEITNTSLTNRSFIRRLSSITLYHKRKEGNTAKINSNNLSLPSPKSDSRPSPKKKTNVSPNQVKGKNSWSVQLIALSPNFNKSFISNFNISPKKVHKINKCDYTLEDDNDPLYNLHFEKNTDISSNDELPNDNNKRDIVRTNENASTQSVKRIVPTTNSRNICNLETVFYDPNKNTSNNNDLNSAIINIPRYVPDFNTFNKTNVPNDLFEDHPFQELTDFNSCDSQISNGGDHGLHDDEMEPEKITELLDIPKIMFSTPGRSILKNKSNNNTTKSVSINEIPSADQFIKAVRFSTLFEPQVFEYCYDY